MSSRTEEVISMVTTTHKLIKGDVTFTEEKKETIITTPSGSQLKEIDVHSRQIGDKSFVVSIEDGNKSETTNMSDDDLEEFHEQWNREWTPSLTQDVISKAIKEASGKETGE
jgi:hypothetical protein